jgi:hypothetical protein
MKMILLLSYNYNQQNENGHAPAQRGKPRKVSL